MAELLLGLLLLFAYSFFRHPPGPNELTRLFSIVAFVDHGTLSIDRYAFQTPDKAFYAGNYYSDKAPGTFILGVPLYAAAERALASLGQPLVRDDALTLLQVALSGLPSAVLGVVLARTLLQLGLPPRSAIDFAALFGFGTMAFSFATLLFGHQLATALAFGGVALLLLHPSPLPPVPIALAGALCGLAAITEYTAAIVGFALLVYLWRRERRNWWWFCAGGLPALAAILTYNQAVFDSPLRLGYAFVDNPDFAEMHAGVFGFTYPTPRRVADLLVTGRGLLFLSPYLVFAWRGYRRLAIRPARTREAKLLLAISLAYLVLDASYYAPTGHWSIGPRFLLPALPCLFVLAAFGMSGVARLKIAAMLCWSVAIVFLGTAIDPKPPGQYAFPLFDYYVPRLVQGDLAPNLVSVVFDVSPGAGATALALVLAIGWAVIRRLTPDSDPS